MKTRNSRPARPARNANDGYLNKILFWQQELDAHTFGRSKYPLSRIEESLAYFKGRHASWQNSQRMIAELEERERAARNTASEKTAYDLKALAQVMRDNCKYNLDDKSSAPDYQAIVCIECVEAGDLMLAEHKMATKVGRNAASAYKTLKEKMYWESLRK